MELFIICVLFAVAVGSAGYGVWRRFYLSPKAKKALYKDLERRAKTGDKEAMYAFAERFYHEKDDVEFVRSFVHRDFYVYRCIRCRGGQRHLRHL